VVVLSGRALSARRVAQRGTAEGHFRAAATRYLKENQDKRSIADDALHFRQLDKFIGDLDLGSVPMGTLQPFIEARRRDEVKAKTINLGLAAVRQGGIGAMSKTCTLYSFTDLAVAALPARGLEVLHPRSPICSSFQRVEKATRG
jgi:hypothetical protein